MSDLSFRLEPYASCADEIVAFRNANRSILRDHAYFDWRYRNRPCAQEAQIVWGIDHQGRRLASASIIPHDYFIDDRVHPLGVLGDISVASELQGRGIGRRMIESLRGAPSLCALSGCIVLPNEGAARSFERAQWSDATLIERYVRILDIGPLLRRRFGGSAPTGWLGRGINAALRIRHRPRAAAPGYETRADEAASFGAEYDALWQELPKRGCVMAVRDRSYLDWRYAQHPAQRHGLFEVRREGSLCAYAVFHRSADDLLVDDFLTLHPDAATVLVDAFVAFARDSAAASIHLRCAGDAFPPVPWTSAGFVKRRDTQRVMVSWSADGAVLADRRWFVTSGDKDV